jgi:hypothetical protein
MRKRDPADIDMRLRQLGGLGNYDVRVNIDRGRRRAPGETVGVVDACGGAAIAILAIDHFIFSAVGSIVRERDDDKVRCFKI